MYNAWTLLQKHSVDEWAMASLEEERRLNALTFDGLPHTHTMESFPIELQDLPRPQSDLEAGKMY